MTNERSQTPITTSLRAHREEAEAERGSDFPGTRLQDFWQVWAKKSSTSQSSKFTTTWLSPRLQNSTQIIENSAHFEQISQQKQRWRSTRSSSGHACKKGDNSCQETLYSGILQQTVSGTQTPEKVETSDRFKYVEHPLTCSNFQNGNSRIYQKVDSKRGVGHLDRPHRRLLSRSNTSTISKISEISDQKRGFPISGSPFWCRDSSPRVYSYCERGKTHSSSQEPQNPSISRRLASSVTNKGSGGHGGRVVTLSPPTSEAGVRSPHGLKWESW